MFANRELRKSAIALASRPGPTWSVWARVLRQRIASPAAFSSSA